MKCCAFSRFTIYLDSTFHTIDYTMDDRQPHSGAFTIFFGGEKWIKNLFNQLLSHTHTGIFDS